MILIFSAIQSLRVSGYQGIRVSMYQGIRVSGYQGLRVLGSQGLRVLGSQGLRVLGSQCLSVLGFQSPRVLGSQGFRYTKCYVQEFLIHIIYYQHPFLTLPNHLAGLIQLTPFHPPLAIHPVVSHLQGGLHLLPSPGSKAGQGGKK